MGPAKSVGRSLRNPHPRARRERRRIYVPKSWWAPSSWRRSRAGRSRSQNGPSRQATGSSATTSSRALDLPVKKRCRRTPRHLGEREKLTRQTWRARPLMRGEEPSARTHDGDCKTRKARSAGKSSRSLTFIAQVKWIRAVPTRMLMAANRHRAQRGARRTHAAVHGTR
jgi:hypothetical protein